MHFAYPEGSRLFNAWTMVVYPWTGNPRSLHRSPHCSSPITPISHLLLITFVQGPRSRAISMSTRTTTHMGLSRHSSSQSIQQLNVSSKERKTQNGRMCLGGIKAKERAWDPDVYGSTIQRTLQRCQKDACSLSLSCPHSHPCHVLKVLAAFTPTQGVWANVKELYHDVEVLWSCQGPRGSGKMKLGNGNVLPKYMRVALIPRKSAKVHRSGLLIDAGAQVFSDAEKRRAYKDGAWPVASDHTGAYGRLTATAQAEEGWRDSEGVLNSDIELEREVFITIYVSSLHVHHLQSFRTREERYLTYGRLYTRCSMLHPSAWERAWASQLKRR